MAAVRSGLERFVASPAHTRVSRAGRASASWRTPLRSMDLFGTRPISSAPHYRLKQIDFDGSFNYSKVVETEVEGPQVFVLSQKYPNPFNPSTMIKFSLPVDAYVIIELFNTLGEKVDELTNRDYSIGNHEISFDASKLSNGVYYYTINANGIDGSSFTSTKKMVLMK